MRELPAADERARSARVRASCPRRLRALRRRSSGTSASCCLRSRSRSCSGIRSRSGSRRTRRRFSAWRWRWRPSAAGLRPAAAAAAEPWLLGLAIGTWVAGFDVLYACQDLDFDRARRSAVDSGAVRRAAIAADFARAARHHGAPPRAARRAGRARRASTSRASRWWRCCSPTNSRWCARRSLAGEARVRSERLGRHPVLRDDGRRGVCRA